MEIRKMFKATDGYIMMSSDYKSQEPRCLAMFCKKAGDSQLYNTFMQNKDLYSEIASKAFNKTYEECLEFNSDGTTNKEGKKRRTQAKQILLGVLYGRGVNSIAEQLKCSKEKAQQIKDSVFKAFPAISRFEQSSKKMARELGYVTTIYGRKRRLPDLQLPEYEFSWKEGVAPDNDVLDFDNTQVITEVSKDIQDYYLKKLHSVNFWNRYKIIEEAMEEGIIIKDNGGKIAQSERQCVNARIQGSAASLSKKAMIELNNNIRLKELGFRILVPVHDEIIAECPKENVKECSELLSNIMSKAAETILGMPIGCDVVCSYNWYGEEVKV